MEERIASVVEVKRQFEDWFKGYLRSHAFGSVPAHYAETFGIFHDAWRRAEGRMLKEPISEFVASRIHKAFEEAEGEYTGHKELLSRGEILLIGAWEQFAERGLAK